MNSSECISFASLVPIIGIPGRPIIPGPFPLSGRGSILKIILKLLVTPHILKITISQAPPIFNFAFSKPFNLIFQTLPDLLTTHKQRGYMNGLYTCLRFISSLSDPFDYRLLLRADACCYFGLNGLQFVLCSLHHLSYLPGIDLIFVEADPKFQILLPLGYLSFSQGFHSIGIWSDGGANGFENLLNNVAFLHQLLNLRVKELISRIRPVLQSLNRHLQKQITHLSSQILCHIQLCQFNYAVCFLFVLQQVLCLYVHLQAQQLVSLVIVEFF